MAFIVSSSLAFQGVDVVVVGSGVLVVVHC